MKFFTILLLLSIYACNPKKEVAQEGNAVVMMPAKTLSVKGDFLGDGYKYTLTAAVTNNSGSAITKIPDPHETEWDSIISYYNKYHLQVRIALNEIKGIDELVFENAQGLYCLINVGDLNGDKRDEIALVPDRLDYSRHNYCCVYSLCALGWEEVFRFSVHEDAFNYTGGVKPVLSNIPDALEFRDHKWWFYDYLDMEYETEKEVGKMKIVKVENCP